MESLRRYLNGLSVAEQCEFCARAGTTLNYLRKALSTKQRMSVELAIALDRESGGAVPMEAIRPDVDWAYIPRAIAQ